MPAYKRLRAEGFSVPHIDGSADLETRATEKCELAMGCVIADPVERSITAELYAEAS